MVHVYCVGSHMYTTDCDITFLVFQCTLLQSSPLRRIQHIFCRDSQSLHAQLRLYFLSSGTNRVECTGAGSIGWKRQPALLSMICGGTCWYWTSFSFWSATIFILMIVTVSWWQLCQGSDLAQTALLCCDMLWWNIAGVGFCGKIVWA